MLRTLDCCLLGSLGHLDINNKETPYKNLKKIRLGLGDKGNYVYHNATSNKKLQETPAHLSLTCIASSQDRTDMVSDRSKT